MILIARAVGLVFSLSLHLDVVLGNPCEEGGNILIGLAKLLFVFSVLGLVVRQLAIAFHFEALVLLTEVCHSLNEIDSFAPGLAKLILVMGLHFRDFFVRGLNRLFLLLSHDVGVLVSERLTCPGVALEFSEFTLGILRILLCVIQKGLILCSCDFVVSHLGLVLLVFRLQA
jgi:hypothetical protein